FGGEQATVGGSRGQTRTKVGSSVLGSFGRFSPVILATNMSVDWIGYGYATLVASGGVIGYVKAELLKLSQV
ncbi:hypothetical protein XENORESO_002090, partial [Xenotaenia resolanae]